MYVVKLTFLLNYAQNTKVSSMKLLIFFGVLFVLKETSANNNEGNNSGLFENRNENFEILQRENKYILEWKVLWEQKQILFNATVSTKGFVAMGLSARGEVVGADFIVGGVLPNGTTYFKDMHGNNEGEIVEDDSQDWKLLSAWENDTHTFLSFARNFETCDEHDYAINVRAELDLTVVKWAYGDNDSLYPVTFQNHENFLVYLLDNNTVPREFKEDSFITGPPAETLLQENDLQLWTVSSKITIPAKETTYYCTMHKGLPLKRKHHIVGFHARHDTEQIINRAHHLLLFRCTPPPNSTASEFFHRYLDYPGEDCYFLNGNSGTLPLRYCTDVKFAQAIGGRIMFYPEHMGISIGETGVDEYYLLQVHYDNPGSDPNLQFEVHLDMYYTDKLRPNEAGIMGMGHQIPGSPSLLIPPQSSSHFIYGHCGGECTQEMLPPEGIKIAFLVLHTHYFGRKVTLRHFRGENELPWILADRNYNGTFQAFRVLKEEKVILPGDHLMIECEFDNTKINGSVVGGFTTKQEMCSFYLFYYNKINDYGTCRSEISDSEYWKHLGITGVAWDESKIDYVATSPEELKGMSIAQISNTKVDWNPSLRWRLQQEHSNRPQKNVCPMLLTSQLHVNQLQHRDFTNQEKFVAHPLKIPQEYAYVESSNC